VNQSAQQAVSEPQVSILLVEPDVISRLVLADYLRGCGYITHESGTAAEALEALRGELPIDIVLAEIQGIGSMTGFELAHAIRTSYPDVDVILTASFGNAAEKCHELCEHRIVKKPYTPQDIVDHIKLLRQRHRSRMKRGSNDG
jgi:CheY-like chemotaxis protein